MYKCPACNAVNIIPECFSTKNFMMKISPLFKDYFEGINSYDV